MNKLEEVISFNTSLQTSHIFRTHSSIPASSKPPNDGFAYGLDPHFSNYNDHLSSGVITAGNQPFCLQHCIKRSLRIRINEKHNSEMQYSRLLQVYANILSIRFECRGFVIGIQAYLFKKGKLHGFIYTYRMYKAWFKLQV